MSETNRAGDLNARTDDDAPRDKKPDAHVLGRGETHVPDEGAVILTDGGHRVESVDASFTPGRAAMRPTSDGGTQRFPELPDFRRDILLTLARSEPTHGQGLREDLGTLRDEDVNDGRLYPNLNALVEDGLVEKREKEHNDRSNEYRLTDRGRASVRDHAQRVTGAVDALETGGDR
jgi:PadR family transcriptional regulator PadR